MTPEQRYRLELAKNNTPSTSLFIWFIPCFVILAWICRNDLPTETHYVKQQYSSHSTGFWPLDSLLEWL